MLKLIQRNENAIGVGLVALNLIVGNFIIAAFVALVVAVTWE